MSRVFVIVLDSFGIGYAPDAEKFGDFGTDTLKGISLSSHFNIPNLKKLGLCNIDGVSIEGVDSPIASYARLREKSNGKDTTTGHWELAGLVSYTPMPTFPDGFPKYVLDKITELTGRNVLCNKAYSGTEVIKDYGDKHLETGALIVYTSADSVLQIAAHTDVVPLEELYSICRKVREFMTGEYGVGRVIARPFETVQGQYVRTADRRDFSLEPHGNTLLDDLKEQGKDVISVGKIYDIFAGRGITEYYLTHSNTEGMQKTLELADKAFDGLCFVNLVEFDSLYGHRNDKDGYAKAISEFDNWLGTFIKKLHVGDTLIVTADHGCDPTDISTDHTREYVPFLMYGNRVTPQNLGTINGFYYVAETVSQLLGVKYKGFTDEQ